MKTQIIILAALFSLSTKALAEDYTKRIRCSKEAAMAKVPEMVEAENKETFKEGLIAVGKKLRTEFIEMINFQEKTAKTTPAEIKDLIWKADCIMVVATMNDVANDVNAKYEKNLGILQSRTEEALQKLPERLNPEELNVFITNTVIQNNRGPVAFTMALFENY